MTDDLNRRRALQLGGATVIAALAGCFDGGDGSLEAGDVPAYTTFLPEGQMSVVYSDLTAFEDAVGLDTQMGEESQSQPDVDPVLRVSGATSGFSLLGGSFALGTFGLDGALPGESTNSGGSNGQNLTTEIEEAVTVGNVFLARGNIDTDEVTQTVQSGGGSFQPETEPAGEVGSYSLFTTVGESAGSTTIGDEEVDTIAIGESELLLSSRSAIETAINTSQGTQQRATEASDPFRWLMSTATDADGAIGGYGPEIFEPGNTGEFLQGALDPVADADGYLGSLAFGDGTVEASMAAVFGEGVTDDQRDAIDEMASDDASDQSLTVDDTRILLSATYDQSALQNASGEGN
jgi:hypothetical protein